jgi:predicted transcriptional regulator
MTKPSRPNSGKEMTTVYGKVPKKLADRLDQLAERRRWSRAQMVAYCIEHFIENEPDAPDDERTSSSDD